MWFRELHSKTFLNDILGNLISGTQTMFSEVIFTIISDWGVSGHISLAITRGRGTLRYVLLPWYWLGKYGQQGQTHQSARLGFTGLSLGRPTSRRFTG